MSLKISLNNEKFEKEMDSLDDELELIKKGNLKDGNWKSFITRSSNPQNYHCLECNGIHRAESGKWYDHRDHIDLPRFIKDANQHIIDECIKWAIKLNREYKEYTYLHNRINLLKNFGDELNQKGKFVFYKIDWEGNLERLSRWDKWGRSFNSANKPQSSVEELISESKKYIEDRHNLNNTIVVMKLVPHQIIQSESEFINFEIEE